MVCAKCRQCPPYGSDTWCIACSGLETLKTELAARWSTPGLRAVANELVVSAVRGVCALRELSGSLESAGRARTLPPPPAPPRAASAEAPRNSRAEERPREPLQRVKAPPESEEEYEEEEGEEEEEVPRSPSVKGVTAKSAPAQRPPEPPFPPRGHREGGQSSRGGHRSRSRERREDRPREGKKKKKRGNRGGSKHPRLYRTLEDPSLKVHRRPPRAFWHQERPLAGHGPREDRR